MGKVLPTVALTSSDIADDAVTSAKIATDAVDTAEIAADAVEASELADDAVDTAAVADNAVTLAKMAGLVRGKIIYGDASGDPAALTVGTANYVLTSDGTDVAWAAVTAADNTPSFGAAPSVTTAIAYDTWTKITLGTELWDTDSAFDHVTNYRFTVPAGEGGKYLFTYKIAFPSAAADQDDMTVVLYKNGARTVYTEGDFEKSTSSSEAFTGQLSCMLALDATDYVELYCYQIGAATTGRTTNTSKTFFTGCKLAGV